MIGICVVHYFIYFVNVSGYKWGLYSGFTFTALAKASDDISRDLVQKLALFFALLSKYHNTYNCQHSGYVPHRRFA